MGPVTGAIKHWAARLTSSPKEQALLDRLVNATAKPITVVKEYNAAKDEMITKVGNEDGWQTVVSSNGVYPTGAAITGTPTMRHFATAMGICNCGDRMCVYSQGGISTGTTTPWSTAPSTVDPFAYEREAWERTTEQLKKERNELARALEVASLPKPVEKRAGHVPTRWLAEAFDMAKNCDAFITIQLEEDGVAVIGRSGEEYGTIALAWEVLEKSPHNPLLKAIEGVERHLSALERLKELVADKDKKAQTIAA